jgi:FkbM family methyltransferase
MIRSNVTRLVSLMGYELLGVFDQFGKRIGFTIRRNTGELGIHPFPDMRTLTSRADNPIIFDVGANVGQSIHLFRTHFPHPIIHSFEPAFDTFCELQRRTRGIPDLYLNNVALGSNPGVLTLFENVNSQMTSLMEPGVDCTGSTRAVREVEVKTLADYCQQREISHIDILKSDTQGFDLNVLKGGARLLELRRIHMIYLEVSFCAMYKGAPRFDEIYAYLLDHGFHLVSFYGMLYRNNRAKETDALFINPSFLSRDDPSPAAAEHDKYAAAAACP